MRFVIQRVTKASVSVEGKLISEICNGLCVLVGICREDTDDDIEYGVRKLLNLRLFDNPENQKRWDKSVVDRQFEILCVSQFTLHSVLKGNKLDFHRSMGPTDAPAFYEKFLQKLRSSYVADKVKDGQFGAYMQVQIENDGPVTINLDSRNKE
ncbi:D-aminoacyl-tRNA deacylase [Aphelenchoides bicaudatus]|nr:D-aminoacyl-tRNA deacylase [Aphelenchoides bicaudatus]